MFHTTKFPPIPINNFIVKAKKQTCFQIFFNTVFYQQNGISNSAFFHTHVESIRVFLVMNFGVWKTYLILVKKSFSMENGNCWFSFYIFTNIQK